MQQTKRYGTDDLSLVLDDAEDAAPPDYILLRLHDGLAIIGLVLLLTGAFSLVRALFGG
jgi:hypothetical protein